MPEAVIVATARTPIGRAQQGFTGRLPSRRPVALSSGRARQGAGARPHAGRRHDLGLRSARRRGRFQRRAASRPSSPGVDVPGVTVNRYCSSSLQTIRMAAHAIKAGEGDVFIAGGVETVSRFRFGAADTGSPNPKFDDARAPVRRSAPRVASLRGRPPQVSPTSTSRWVRPRRTSSRPKVSRAKRWTSSRCGRSNSRSKRRRTASSIGRSCR